MKNKRILILTQAIDRADTSMGFFHRWAEEFSNHFENITIICLKKGDYILPNNVKVFSLGKEEKQSRVIYLYRFFKYTIGKLNEYDEVFVHMNQEYVLLGGLFWKLFDKKIFLWRNHAKGNILTDIAVGFSSKVFCTSTSSYTAKFKKTIIMPVGIDTELFKPDSSIIKKQNSILFFGRIAPVKKVIEFVDWLSDLEVEGRVFNATIAGDTLPEDINYHKKVLETISGHKLNEKINFVNGLKQSEAPRLYQSYETYVNFTPSGSMDKTILEAAACGTKVIVRNDDLKILESKSSKELRDFVVENHSLNKLMERLEKEL